MHGVVDAGPELFRKLEDLAERRLGKKDTQHAGAVVNPRQRAKGAAVADIDAEAVAVERVEPPSEAIAGVRLSVALVRRGNNARALGLITAHFQTSRSRQDAPPLEDAVGIEHGEKVQVVVQGGPHTASHARIGGEITRFRKGRAGHAARREDVLPHECVKRCAGHDLDHAPDHMHRDASVEKLRARLGAQRRVFLCNDGHGLFQSDGWVVKGGGRAAHPRSVRHALPDGRVGPLG